MKNEFEMLVVDRKQMCRLLRDIELFLSQVAARSATENLARHMLMERVQDLRLVFNTRG